MEPSCGKTGFQNAIKVHSKSANGCGDNILLKARTQHLTACGNFMRWHLCSMCTLRTLSKVFSRKYVVKNFTGWPSIAVPRRHCVIFSTTAVASGPILIDLIVANNDARYRILIVANNDARYQINKDRARCYSRCREYDAVVHSARSCATIKKDRDLVERRWPGAVPL